MATFPRYSGNKPLICGPKNVDSNFSHPSVNGYANTSLLRIHGLRYIVDEDPSGAFANALPNDIATYQSDINAWVFDHPYIGMEVLDRVNQQLLHFNGTIWEEVFDFNSNYHEIPFAVSIGGTSATEPYEATDNLNAAHCVTFLHENLIKYNKYVIPLFPIANTVATTSSSTEESGGIAALSVESALQPYTINDDIGTNNFCIGDILLKKNDAENNMFYRISISATMGLTENSTPLWGMSVVGTVASVVLPCTFTYLETKYFGLMVDTSLGIFNFAQFLGNGSHIKYLQMIPYTNSQTNEVINSEINASLSMFDTTTALNTKVYGLATADITIGKLTYANFPEGLENQVLALVKQTDGELQIQWVTLENTNINPDTPSDDPWNVTEDIIDGMTPTELYESTDIKIFDGRTPTILIETETVTIYDGADCTSLPTDEPPAI